MLKEIGEEFQESPHLDILQHFFVYRSLVVRRQIITVHTELTHNRNVFLQVLTQVPRLISRRVGELDEQ